MYLVGGGDSLLSTPGFQASREYKDQPFNEFNQLADRIQARVRPPIRELYDKLEAPLTMLNKKTGDGRCF